MTIKDSVPFPNPIRQNGRLYWDRFEIENYKRVLIGLEPVERDPMNPILLASAKQVAAEFGFGRRTLGRRVCGHEKPMTPEYRYSAI
jgi:hypothetical protein